MSCNHDCSSCSENCQDRKPESLIEKPHDLSQIKKVIGIVSGKGGVGKSLVTSLLTVSMQRRGYKCAILDADITGPSIPQMFGVHDKATGSEDGLFPVESKFKTKLMSVNLLLPDETDPVVWRGPVIGGTVKQFWTDVIWGDVDFMFVDMPPGTGDVALTVFQSLPIDGIVVVTSPQELVSMIVGKAVKMANMLNVPILGIVENMSYFECPDCKSRHYIYGESKIDELSEKYSIDKVIKMPFDPHLAASCDKGMIELYDGTFIEELSDKLEGLENNAQ